MPTVRKGDRQRFVAIAYFISLTLRAGRHHCRLVAELAAQFNLLPWDKVLGRYIYLLFKWGPISHVNRSLSAVYLIYMGGYYNVPLFYLIPLYILRG